MIIHNYNKTKKGSSYNKNYPFYRQLSIIYSVDYFSLLKRSQITIPEVTETFKECLVPY